MPTIVPDSPSASVSTAAFMPGASPPLVRIAILKIISSRSTLFRIGNYTREAPQPHDTALMYRLTVIKYERSRLRFELIMAFYARSQVPYRRLYRMICENCEVRPASVQVSRQQGGQRISNYLCTQCARELGMIGSGAGGFDPFVILQNLVQQQQGAAGGSPFNALSREAQEAVLRAREASAGTTRTAAIGTDHLLAGIVTGDNVATEALKQAGADVDGMRVRFQEFRGDPGDEVYTFTPSAKRALQLSFAAARQMGVAQVGSEHLLLGLLGEGDGNVYRILQQHGANDAEALRREILRLMQQRGAQTGPGAGMPGAAAGGPGMGGGQQGTDSNTPTLDQVSRDLTQAARDGELDPVIGRAEEISRVIRILSRRTKNNPV